MVGTSVVEATPAFTCRRNSDGSHRRMIRMGAPRASAASPNVRGAPWNSCDAMRWMPSPGKRAASAQPELRSNASEKGDCPDHGCTTPLGRPVVPDVYDIRQPRRSAGSGPWS